MIKIKKLISMFVASAFLLSSLAFAAEPVKTDVVKVPAKKVHVAKKPVLKNHSAAKKVVAKKK